MIQRSFKGCGVALLAGLVLLAGCASVPENLDPVPEEPLGLTEVRTDSEAHRGQTIVWGGELVSIENTREGTRIEVVARPLDRAMRPREADLSEGRFRVWVDDFLDPKVFTEGREVTVRGVVAGVEDATIGEYLYPFVTVEQAVVHLWAERPPPRPRYAYDPWYDPWGPPGYMGPYWRPSPHYWRHDPRYW